MSYELIQSALTATVNIVAIAGLTGIIAHAFWKQHQRFMSTYCPPVTPYTPDTQAEEASAPNPEQLYCPINPDDYWASATPDGSSWEIATPLTCEWTPPAQPKRRRGRPKKQAA